ncbi:MAG TPA: hypothetical protein VGK26_11115 [Thermoanaerobaculia bacterium]
MKGARAAAPIRVVAVVATLTLLSALVRLVSLRALPIFGDEALNLRMAVLAAKEPFSRMWISLQESQPPLHVWLLALFLPFSRDPLLAGRLLSVVTGILCVPAAAWTVRRTLEAFDAGTGVAQNRIAARDAAENRVVARDAAQNRVAARDAAQSQVISWLVAALAGLCPFFVFAERLARVDGLFLLETILAAGLSAAVAQASLRGEASPAPALSLGAALGALMGLTMLTRQAVSYPLWLLAPAAWLLLPSERRVLPSERRAGSVLRFAAALALAAAVAVALWLPMLLAPGEPDAFTRIFHSADYRPAMTLAARLRVTLDGVRVAVEAFWLYLTPPVFLLALVGFGVVALAARWRLLAYLVLWEALLLAPAAAFAGTYFPRYALPAAIPVCLVAALGAARVWTILESRLAGAAARSLLGVALIAALLGPSLLDLTCGERNWRNWRLLPVDRMQFLSGPPAGFASEAAVGALRGIAGERPAGIAVLTPGISGNPTDAVWLLLGGDPRVRLSYASDALAVPLLPPPDPDGTRRVPGDARDPLRREQTLPARMPVFAVVPDPLLTRSGWVDAVPFLSRLNPRISEVARFRNPAEPGSPANGVVVLELPPER